MASVSFTVPSEYDIQARQIERRRRLAELLQAQSAESLPTNRMAGGYVVPINPMEGLAKIAQAWASGRMQKRADEQSRELIGKMQAERSATLARALEAGKGAEIPAPPPELGGGPGRPAQPNPQAMYEILAGANDPALAQVGMQGLLKQFAEPTRIDLGDRIGLYRNGVLVGEIPKGATPDAVLRERGAQARHETPSGSAMLQEQGRNFRFANDPNKPFVIGPDGKPVANQAFQDFAMQKAAAGAARNNVVVNTEKNLFGDMAGAVGKQIATGAEQARAAVSTINTINRVRDAIASGKVIAGPGTTPRQWIGQVGQVLGISGKDATEQLTQTRTAIQGLAQLELDAAQQMKGQGQITEAERLIIRRAASGDIDGMSVPELNTLMGVLDKAARFKIAANQQNVERLKQYPEAGPLPQFMEVPMPPEYAKPEQRNPRGRVVVDY